MRWLCLPCAPCLLTCCRAIPESTLSLPRVQADHPLFHHRAEAFYVEEHQGGPSSAAPGSQPAVRAYRTATWGYTPQDVIPACSRGSCAQKGGKLPAKKGARSLGTRLLEKMASGNGWEGADDIAAHALHMGDMHRALGLVFGDQAGAKRRRSLAKCALNPLTFEFRSTNIIFHGILSIWALGYQADTKRRRSPAKCSPSPFIL